MWPYDTKRWAIKRKQILKRDGYACQECKRYGRNRDASAVHHIKPVETHPGLAFDKNNLESLCAACHNKKHPEKIKKAQYKKTSPPD